MWLNANNITLNINLSFLSLRLCVYNFFYNSSPDYMKYSSKMVENRVVQFRIEKNKLNKQQLNWAKSYPIFILIKLIKFIQSPKMKYIWTKLTVEDAIDVAFQSLSIALNKFTSLNELNWSCCRFDIDHKESACLDHAYQVRYWKQFWSSTESLLSSS